MILDLQFGSTGKGLIAGYLAHRFKPDTLVTAWAANAGHTYIDHTGRKFVHTMLANGIVSPALKRILIGPGSLINPDALMQELASVGDILGNDFLQIPGKIMIHPHAAIILQRHIDEEAGPMTKIGSTKKGVGAAACERIRRDPDQNNAACNALPAMNHILADYLCTVAEYNTALDLGRRIQVEGAQGYSLSMYHGLYPYTTSRDVTTAQVLADCGIPADWLHDTEVIGTARTFPIRVANRFDDAGKQVGYSGNGYPDQQELDWKELGMAAELTTVTKLPRRIFTFSKTQLAEAVRQCGVDSLFLNFVNYCRTENELIDLISTAAAPMIERATARKGGDFAMYFGFGPADADVHWVPNYLTDMPDAMASIIERWRDSREKMLGKPATNWIGGVPSFASEQV